MKLRIYSSADAVEPEREVWLNSIANDRWAATIDADLLGKFYTYELYFRGKSWGETPGPNATAVSLNGQRAAIIDMEATNPDGWQTDSRPHIENPSSLVVYELHYRDFSVHPLSPYEHKGKYLALTEPRALFYLKTLGVNAVQLMPSFDFATVDESQPNLPQYNWGYDPQNYNVPEGSYATDAIDPSVRIREFKQMVMALHSAGIRVILDVVYNHCYSIPSSPFQRTYPDYYFRMYTDAEGQTLSSNGSGCGSETASERPLMRQFMIDSVTFWAREYHIDGFRFDLMGIHDMETMRQIRQALDAIDPSITIYGEGWSGGLCALDPSLLATKSNIKTLMGIGAFGNEMRDAIRGPFDDDTRQGWLSGRYGYGESLKFGIVGAIWHPEVDMSRVNYTHEPWAQEPIQHVSYVSCHDDLCLFDRLRASFPSASDELLERLAMLALTPVLLGQGIPFLYNGDEVLRTKQGVRNSYNSPDEVNCIDWQNLRLHPDLFLYCRGLIHLRHAHPAFHMGAAELVRKHLHFIANSKNLIAFRLNGAAVGDSWKTIYVFLNPNPKPQHITLPEAQYTIVCKGGKINPEGLAHSKGGDIVIPSRQALILHTHQ